MAYDDDLATRIRALLGDAPDVTEKRMFGGLAFLTGGNLAIAASGRGGLMVRVDPAETDALVARPGVGPMVMRDRPIDGWVRVETGRVRGDRELAEWVARGAHYARSLAPRAAA